MMGTFLYDLATQYWAKTNPGADYTASGYPTYANTGTKPSGDGVIAFGDQGTVAAKHLLLLPYGNGSSFGMKILGWAPTNMGIGTPLWCYVELATYAITLGSSTGVANSDIPASNLFAYSCVCSTGPTLTGGVSPICPDWATIIPGSASQGMIVQEVFGFNLIQVLYSSNGTNTCNALWRKR